MVKNLLYLQCRTPGFDSWVGKIPWRREWQPTSVFLPGESQGQRNSVELQSQIWLSNTHMCARAHTHTHTHTHTHFHIHKGAQKRFARALSKTQTKASSHFVLKWDFKFFLCIVLLFCDQRIPCSWYNMWKLQINFKKPKSGIYSPTSYC